MKLVSDFLRRFCTKREGTRKQTGDEIVICPECQGTGLLKVGTDEPCDVCHGWGRFSERLMEYLVEPGGGSP